jgi:hypothetical protein
MGLFDKDGDAITDYRFDSGIRIGSVPDLSLTGARRRSAPKNSALNS